MGWCGGMAWWEGGRERGQGSAMEWTEHVCVCMCVCAICVCWGGGVLFQQSPLKHEPFTCVLTHVSTYMCTIAQLISKDHKSCACMCVCACVHFQACKCTEFRHTGLHGCAVCRLRVHTSAVRWLKQNILFPNVCAMATWHHEDNVSFFGVQMKMQDFGGTINSRCTVFGTQLFV